MKTFLQLHRLFYFFRNFLLTPGGRPLHLVPVQVKMANKKASLKSIRQAAVRTKRNAGLRSRLKTLAKKVGALAGAEQRREAAIRYVSAMDKAQKVGLVHAHKSARCKSVMAAYIF
jgi:ribosomal protein S20